MRISLDGRTVARVKVGSRRWRSYGGAKSARRGSHKVGIRFLGPRKTRSCRRAIALDKVVLDRTQDAPAHAATAPASARHGRAGDPARPLPESRLHRPRGRWLRRPDGARRRRPPRSYWAYATGGLFLVAHSTDLVNWTDEGAAMTSRPEWTDQDGEWNPWAPSVIERDEPCPDADDGPCFVMFFVSVNRDVTPNANCIGVATSTTPGGPFTDQGILEDEEESRDQSGRPLGCGDDAGYSNIDPAPFVDTDGTPYLYLSTGHQCLNGEPPNAVCDWNRELSVIPLAEDMLSAVGPRQPLLGNDNGWDQGIVENPWPSLNGDTYELVFSGGNFQRAYGMGSGTAAAPTGPFSKQASNPFLQDSPQVRSAGGGMLLTGPKDDGWAAYHGRQTSYDQPRTLRIDRIARRSDGTLSGLTPSSTPQRDP